MKKTKKMVIIFLIIAMCGTLLPAVASMVVKPGKAKSDVNLVSKFKPVLKPIEKYITTLYYDQGSYSEYKSSLLNPEKALDEASFDNVRKETTANDYFKYDSQTPEGMIKHMIYIEKDNQIIVYYLKDINSKQEMKKAKTWTLEKKSGNWLIKK